MFKKYIYNMPMNLSADIYVSKNSPELNIYFAY